MNSLKRGEIAPRRPRRKLLISVASATPPAGSSRRILGLLLMVLTVGAAQGQEALEPEFSLLGSVSQKITYAAPDWNQEPGSSWTFTADLKPRFSYGPAVFLAESTWTLPLTASLTAATPTVAVSQAYFRFTPVEGFDLTFGQKRYNLGVGQTFTVGDSINPVIGFFDQKTGFRGATAEWSPLSWLSASAALSTETGRVETLAGAGQLSLLIDKLQVTSSLVAQKDMSFNPAIAVSYDLWAMIITTEAAAEFMPQGLRPSGPAASWQVPDAWTEPALSASTGARYTVTLFEIDVTASAEYLYWSQGWTEGETDDWQTAAANPATMALAQQARLATDGIRGRHNAFLRLSLVSGTVFSASTFAAVDLQDASVLGQGSVTWAPWDNLELTATLQAAAGPSGSSWEFLNTIPDRYQASFTTTYHF